MTTRQVVLAALVLAVVCCGVMWFLEGFRISQMRDEWQSWVASLPTTAGDQGAAE